MTRAPSAASWRAIAKPMPLVEPEISAVLSFSSRFMVEVDRDRGGYASGTEAAIDGEIRACDEDGFRAGEKGDQRRDLVRGAVARHCEHLFHEDGRELATRGIHLHNDRARLHIV